MIFAAIFRRLLRIPGICRGTSARVEMFINRVATPRTETSGVEKEFATRGDQSAVGRVTVSMPPISARCEQFWLREKLNLVYK